MFLGQNDKNKNESKHINSFSQYLEMLPIDIRDVRNSSSSSNLIDAKFPHYFRRLCDIRQMDFEATFDQMLNLLSIEPQRA